MPKNGFLKYRFSTFIIFLVSLIPLIFFMRKNKPDYIMIHMITSLPLILFNLLEFKTKIILRISGSPKINFLRKKLWKFSEKKINMVTCPTNDLKKSLVESKIFNKDKVINLYDPIINIEEFIKKKGKNNRKFLENEDRSYFIAAGRLTKQKDFYLIKELKKFLILILKKNY